MDIDMFQTFLVTVNGFLPENPPLLSLPPYFAPWDHAAAILSTLNKKKETRAYINQNVPLLDHTMLQTIEEHQRAYSILCLLANSYLWSEQEAPKLLPKQIAAPLWHVSQHIGIAPLLTHAAVDLYNWRLIDPSKPINIDNMKTIYSMTGTETEEWFFLIMTDIEHKAANCIRNTMIISKLSHDDPQIPALLDEIHMAIGDMIMVLKRLREKCVPDDFYHVLRPYLWGTEKIVDSTGAPGIIYEGVNDNEPLVYAGGSAAQSTVLPILDIFFGIDHKDPYFKSIVEYMPKCHRELITWMREHSTFKDQIKLSNDNQLKDKFNDCVTGIKSFRYIHYSIVKDYVIKFIGDDGKGSGGTELKKFLMGAIKETGETKV